MNNDCDEWIAAYLKQHNGNVENLCREATAQMVKDIPRLTRHRGHVESFAGYRHQHWWCLDGCIVVDPTASQFSKYGGVYHYDEFTGPEPTGKCADCGELIFNREIFCNDVCAQNTLEYMQKNSAKLDALNDGT